jgi:hypothetical protein
MDSSTLAIIGLVSILGTFLTAYIFNMFLKGSQTAKFAEAQMLLLAKMAEQQGVSMDFIDNVKEQAYK